MTVKTGTFYWVVCSCCGEVADDENMLSHSKSEAIEASENFDFMPVVVSAEAQQLCSDCWEWPEDVPGYDEATSTSDDPVRAHDQHPVKAVVP